METSKVTERHQDQPEGLEEELFLKREGQESGIAEAIEEEVIFQPEQPSVPKEPAIGDPPEHEQGPSYDVSSQEELPALGTEEVQEPPSPIDVGPIDTSLFGLIELLLKDRPRLYLALRNQEQLAQMIPGFLTITLLAMMIVSGILGTYSSGWQVVFVAVKLPLLLLLTLAVCHASFWSWGLYFRTKLQSSQVAALTLAAVSTTSLLLLGASPILWLAIGEGTTALTKLSLKQQELHYHRAILALVLTFGLAGFAGLRVLYKGLMAMLSNTAKQVAQGVRGGVMGARMMAGVWLGLYSIVGLQMSWLLRPYLFHPWANGRPLTFVRGMDGNVFEAVFKTMLNLMGM